MNLPFRSPTALRPWALPVLVSQSISRSSREAPFYYAATRALASAEPIYSVVFSVIYAATPGQRYQTILALCTPHSHGILIREIK